MSVPPCHAFRIFFGLPVLVLVAAVGCAVSTYDADYKARFAAFLVDAEFAELDAVPREFADGRVRVHLPAKFDPVEEESRPVSLAFLRNLEEAAAFNAKLFAASDLERRPVAAVAVVPTSRRKPDDLKREIVEWIGQDGTFGVRTWESRKIDPVKGGPADWNVLSLDGRQTFEATKAGVEGLVDEELQGTGSLWLSASPDRDHCVVLAVRMPDDVTDQFRTPAARLAELMARRVEILPPAASDTASPPR